MSFASPVPTRGAAAGRVLGRRQRGETGVACPLALRAGVWINSSSSSGIKDLMPMGP